MSGAREPPSERAALMANQPSAKQIAAQLCGQSPSYRCQRAQGTEPAPVNQRIVERKKVYDALMAKPLPELRKFAVQLRDRYAKLLQEAKQKPTFLSVPWKQYEGWLRDLDERLHLSTEAEKTGDEKQAKRQLALLYFDVQVDVERIREEIDLPVGDFEFVLGSTVNTVAELAKDTKEVVTEVGRTAKAFLDGSDQVSIGDRLLPTLGTGTKVVLGLGAAWLLLHEARPLLDR